MLQYQDTEQHPLIHAAAMMILLAAVIAVPFGASARDVAVNSGNSSETNDADRGVRIAQGSGVEKQGGDVGGQEQQPNTAPAGAKNKSQPPITKCTPTECKNKQMDCILDCPKSPPAVNGNCRNACLSKTFGCGCGG